MKVESKYDIGDKVVLARYQRVDTEVRCPDCLGGCTWKATIPCGDELDIECPTCQRGYRSWGTVKDQSMQACFKDLTIGLVTFDGDGWRYMCEETGIGTGTNYREEMLFPSREEAEAAIPAMRAEAEAQSLRFQEDQAAAWARKRKSAGGMAAYYRANRRKAMARPEGC